MKQHRLFCVLEFWVTLY